jgi:hypothetical protein
MLERIGCKEVEVEFLDYNMLRFEEFSAEHIECPATIVEDASQSDTLLAAGRHPVNEPIARIDCGGSQPSHGSRPRAARATCSS